MRFLLILILFFFSAVSTAFAHGGFEKRAGTIVVYILQDPISPLVGEKVNISFKLIDESIKPKTNNMSEKNLVNFPVSLKVVDTYYGDATKDKIIHKQDMRTDANGSFSFEYTFGKENYFDIDLDFVDREGEKQEVGFLIQTRNTGGSEFVPNGDTKKYLENIQEENNTAFEFNWSLVFSTLRFVFWF